MKIYKTSPSDLQLYFDCPQCWYLKQTGHRQKTSGAMLFGTRLHKAIEQYHRNAFFDRLLIEESMHSYLDEYVKKYTFDYQVVEEFWRVPLFDTGIFLNTKVDLIKDDYIIDHKTSARPYSQSFIDSHRQVTAYSYSWHQQYQQPEKGIKFNIFYTNPKPDQPLLEVFETFRNKEHFDEWEQWVREILRGIAADEFEPNPKARWHNYEACPHYKEREVNDLYDR